MYYKQIKIMKTKKSMFKLFSIIILTSIIFSCNQNKIDPALVLDEIFVPEGYHQIDNPSSDALARLEELRLENTNSHYYYLERENKTVSSAREWVFPQKELKIEFTDFERLESREQNSKLMGLIVKKIVGDWREEEFIIIESQPSPKEGMKAFFAYISENLKYPSEAKEMGIQGKVFVEFVVDKDGKLINIKSVKGIGAGCDEEAIRVLKEAPIWMPGMVVDMPVKVRMILPITYKLG